MKKGQQESVSLRQDAVINQVAATLKIDVSHQKIRVERVGKQSIGAEQLCSRLHHGQPGHAVAKRHIVEPIDQPRPGVNAQADPVANIGWSKNWSSPN